MTGRRVFAEIAPKLFDNGWRSVLPLAGKRPVVEGWSHYNQEPVPENTLEEWCQRWPGANVGLALGRGVWALDIDITDPVTSRQVGRLADDLLGPSPAVRIGRSPKSARLYAGDVRSAKRHPIEVFGNSGQMAIYGNHPDTGRPYFWPDSEPLWLSPEDLPHVEAEAVEFFLGEAARSIGQHGAKPAGAAGGGSTGDFEALRAARRGKRGQDWRIAIEAQLAGAVSGSLHDTLVSVVASMVSRGYADGTIHWLVDRHFAAPHTGPYAAVWNQVEAAIAGARRKYRPGIPAGRQAVRRG